jgi:hypothetical protein
MGRMVATSEIAFAGRRLLVTEAVKMGMFRFPRAIRLWLCRYAALGTVKWIALRDATR